MADQTVNLGFRTDTQQIDRAADSARKLRRELDDTSRVTRNWSVIAFQAGQAAQDFSIGMERGLGPALLYSMNNLSFMASMLGLGGRFQFGLQLGITGVALLAQNWNRLAEAMSGGPQFRDRERELENINKRLDELKEKAKSDPMAFANLPNAEREAKRAQELEGIRREFVLADDPLQKERAAAVKQALTGVDVNALTEQMGQSLASAGFEPSAPLKKRRENAMRAVADAQATMDEFKKAPFGDRDPDEMLHIESDLQYAQTQLKEVERAVQREAVMYAQDMITSVMSGLAFNMRGLSLALGAVGRRDLAMRLREAMRRGAESKLKREAAQMMQQAGINAASIAAAPGQALAGEEAGMAVGAAAYANMENAGLTAQEQGAVAYNLTDKHIRPTMMAVPVLISALRDAGASDREIYQLMPQFMRDVRSGMNVQRAALKAVNTLQRAGLRMGNRLGARPMDAMRQDQMMMGAQMMGLAPAQNPAAFSRLGGGAPGLMDDKGENKINENLGELATQLRKAREDGIPAILGRQRRPPG